MNRLEATIKTNSFDEIIIYKNSAHVFAAVYSVTNVPYHLHSSAFELVCVLRGSITCYDSSLKSTLHENEVHVANRHEAHKIVSDDPNNLVLSIQLNADYYGDLLSPNEVIEFVTGVENRNMLSAAEYRQLRYFMARIYEVYTAPDCSEIELESLTRQMIQCLLNNFKPYKYIDNIGEIKCVHRVNPGIDDDEFNRIYRIIDYIMNHYNEKISLDDLAEIEYLNPSYLSRYFKKTLGMNFSRFLHACRMYEAVQLVLTTNKQMDIIATETGFSSRSYMTKIFRLEFGQTPLQIRKTSREDIRCESYDIDNDTVSQIIQKYINGIL